MAAKKKPKPKLSVEQAAWELLAVIHRNGTWDEGCFYYGNRSASELQKPMNDLKIALEALGSTDQ